MNHIICQRTVQFNLIRITLLTISMSFLLIGFDVESLEFDQHDQVILQHIPEWSQIRESIRELQKVISSLLTELKFTKK